MDTPIKTRTLKKADREVDFFFMNGYDVDGVSVRSAVCGGTATMPSTLFVCIAAPEFIGSGDFWQAFFLFFQNCTTDYMYEGHFSE
jgi:hypothetical protein